MQTSPTSTQDRLPSCIANIDSPPAQNQLINSHVDQCIKKQLDTIFSPKRKKPEVYIREKPSLLPSSTLKGKSPAMDKEQNDIELIDSDDSDIESIDKNQEQQDMPDRDLTAKEVKALMTVASMLCMSSSIHGDTTQDYLKKQLYIDRRERIPDSALKVCCRIANAVKCLVPKEDGSPFQRCSLFQMHNSVVSFLSRFKQEKAKKSISTDRRQSRKSVTIDAAVLYLLLAKELHVYKSGGTEFTN